MILSAVNIWSTVFIEIFSSRIEPLTLSCVIVAALKSPVREPLLSAIVQGPPSTLYSVLISFGFAIALLNPGKSFISSMESALLYKRTSSIRPLKYLLLLSFPILKSSKEAVLIVPGVVDDIVSNWPSTYSRTWLTSVAPLGKTAQTWCHWLSLKSVVPNMCPPVISNLNAPLFGLLCRSLSDDFLPFVPSPQYAIAPAEDVLIHAAIVLEFEPEIPL